MNIKGQKTILRAIEASDSEFLKSMINDPELEYMLGGWSFPVSSQAQDKWISNLSNQSNTLRCIIESADSHNPVGAVILSEIDFKNGNAEAHIKIAKSESRRKGYGTDALNALVNFAFSELRLICVFARINVNNAPSRNLFKKCGFTEEGVMRKRIFKNGEFTDVVMLSILCQ